jgi:predicted methyltransferase MtxX (methanogen marker protein 4)
MPTISEVIEKNLPLGKPKVGFGLLEPNEEILQSLQRAQDTADIILVGPQAIAEVEGFTKVIDENPEKRLAEMLVKAEVDGIVRGTIDDFRTFDAYTELVGKEAVVNMRELAFMEDAKGRQFFLSDCSNTRGWTVEEKVFGTVGIADFMQEILEIKPLVGVLAGVRHETFIRKKAREQLTDLEKYLQQTYDDANQVVEQLKHKGIEVKNYSIDLGDAVEEGMNIIGIRYKNVGIV